jgi:glutamate formiminotransferase
VGDDTQIVEALLAGIACARDCIDLRRHEGVHPRIGAADIVPVVAVRPEDAERARAAAREVARRVGEELGLPVFLYAELGRGRGPAFFRHGGPEQLQRRIEDGELAPDFGPSTLHPTAGGVMVGARRPLIAFNVDLANADVDAARAIARVVRERDGGFPGVRALGLDLPQAGHAQISMNVEDWEAAALHDIVAAIEREAAARGVELAGAELVGLMPGGAAVAAAGALLRIRGFDASHVLELRLLE